MRSTFTMVIIGYTTILFPSAIGRAIKRAAELVARAVECVVPRPSFGLVDRKTFKRTAEETTEREVHFHPTLAGPEPPATPCCATSCPQLASLRRHVQTHGAPNGLSSRASSRLRAFAHGFVGITRSEALQWMVTHSFQARRACACENFLRAFFHAIEELLVDSAFADHMKARLSDCLRSELRTTMQNLSPTKQPSMTEVSG